MLYTVPLFREKLADYHRVDEKLRRLVAQGKLIRLRRGLYTDNQFESRFEFAAAILSPAYVSFESALSYYGLIPEFVPNVTSATTGKKKRKTFANSICLYLYQDIPQAAFPYGVCVIESTKGNPPILIATPEKALCDLVYCLKPIRSLRAMREFLFEDMRIDEEAIETIDRKFVFEISQKYRSLNVVMLSKFLLASRS